MKKFQLAVISLLFACTLPAQSAYWQQEVDYSIRVTLNDREHSLDGDLDIRYRNQSPDTLRFIWFHIWPNAYKNDKTAFAEQMLENGDTRFYFSKEEQKGYINKLDFKVDGRTAITEDHPQHIDIMKLILPIPLLPGQQIHISTPFHVKLPFNFSRGGHDGQSYQLTQWYPKPAVYDQKGWHPMPYLDQGEFYSEFGRFEVKITVPANYVVAATGLLQESAEKEWLKNRSAFDWQPVREKTKTKGGQITSTLQRFPESAGTTKTLTYVQDKIHDFAWFADKRFIVLQDSCRLPSGRTVNVFSYFTPGEKEHWKNSLSDAKDALLHYSSLVGEYPYDVVSVVQGPESFGGGMEYPTITVISPMRNRRELDYTIAHEIGHNWFYGVLANNERNHPWLDEGINSFYEYKYREKKEKRFSPSFEQHLLETMIREQKDQPIALPAPAFTELNYGLVVYHKTATWMMWLEKELGPDVLQQSMQAYFRQWQFRHPGPDDFKKSLETSSGRNLDRAFSLLEQTGSLPGHKKKGLAVTGLFKGFTRPGTKEPAKQSAALLSFFPAAGFNSYDKLMAGAALTNLRVPLNRFQFFISPLYSFGAGKLKGTGFINYRFYPRSVFRKIDIGISAASFTADRYTDERGRKIQPGFIKAVPGIRFTLAEKNARATRYRFFELRSFLFREDQFSFYRDTVISGADTSIYNTAGLLAKNRSLLQANFRMENNRKLFPWRAELRSELGDGFLRTSFTGHYFFNYASGGGLRVRFFAGKFFYTREKTINRQFATDRYHLNMTGPNGYEDYTYSDYFAGRNEFSGLASQQIMERDGGFKVRTDLLAEKTGRTDNWLMAANFSSSIPSSVNPLSLLPVKIPLRIFAGIGTYAAAWDEDSDKDRFLFEAGMELPLFRETIRIYLPLVYSKVYRDYYESTIPKKERFARKISFTIDISQFNWRKFDTNLDF